MPARIGEAMAWHRQDPDRSTTGDEAGRPLTAADRFHDPTQCSLHHARQDDNMLHCCPDANVSQSQEIVIASIIRTGCAGWSIPGAQSAHFPLEGSHLERYATVLDCVEINSSFYRSHQAKTYTRWHDSVPDTFRFSVKLPKTISHEARLLDTEALLDRFIGEASHLQHKLGCILVQLPPGLAFNLVTADKFFQAVKARTTTSLVCEPRHSSWGSLEAKELLAQHGIAMVQADPPAFSALPSEQGQQRPCSALLYLRLHGSPIIYRSSYSAQALQAVAQQLLQAAMENRQAWCIFDNTAEGAAMPNALAMMDALKSNS
ncbi:MAG: DUF72 domain-containing protein [Janthinobacterium lividum]